MHACVYACTNAHASVHLSLCLIFGLKYLTKWHSFKKQFQKLFSLHVFYLQNGLNLDDTQLQKSAPLSEVTNLVTISMVEKALAKSKGKLYAAFLDFRKAYDSVNRNILSDGSRKAGGKMLMALRAMYSSVVASVRVEAGCTTEEFSCPVGLKQGECSSPLLFSFLFNELATTVREKGTHRVQFVQGMTEVFFTAVCKWCGAGVLNICG